MQSLLQFLKAKFAKPSGESIFPQESSYHDLKAAMVSSMEEFFRVVSVSMMIINKGDLDGSGVRM